VFSEFFECLPYFSCQALYFSTAHLALGIFISEVLINLHITRKVNTNYRCKYAEISVGKKWGKFLERQEKMAKKGLTVLTFGNTSQKESN